VIPVDCRGTLRCNAGVRYPFPALIIVLWPARWRMRATTEEGGDDGATARYFAVSVTLVLYLDASTRHDLPRSRPRPAPPCVVAGGDRWHRGARESPVPDRRQGRARRLARRRGYCRRWGVSRHSRSLSQRIAAAAEWHVVRRFRHAGADTCRDRLGLASEHSGLLAMRPRAAVACIYRRRGCSARARPGASGDHLDTRNLGICDSAAHARTRARV